MSDDGQENIFEQITRLFASNKENYFSEARRMLSNCEEARDVVSETFLKALKTAERFDSRISPLRVWVHKIFRNTILDELRTRKSRRVVPVSLIEDMGAAENLIEISSLDESEFNEQLEQHLRSRSVPSEDRMALCLIASGHTVKYSVATAGLKSGSIRRISREHGQLVLDFIASLNRLGKETSLRKILEDTHVSKSKFRH